MYKFLNIFKITVIIFIIIVATAACGKKVTEEVYDGSQISETNIKTDESTAETISKSFNPKVIKDIETIKKMKSWLEYFYYNNLFDFDLNNETGEISEDAMISFAASYIMQLEHKGLRFDTDTFHLYIPKNVLEEVVERFFNYKIKNHHSISKHKILFENDEYVIEAAVREWLTRLDIIYIKELEPKKYMAVLNGFNVELGEVQYQIHGQFREINGRYVLTNFKIISDKSLFVEGNPLELGNPNNENNEENLQDYQEPDIKEPENDENGEKDLNSNE